MSYTDRVDEIITTWAAARPDLDFAPLEVFSRLTRIAKQLNRLRAAAFAEANLEVWEFDVLAVLRRAGDPFRVEIKTLVEATMVSSGTMTNRIDRMIEHGLVERVQNPLDGRGFLVEMTDHGCDRVDTAITALTAAEKRWLSALPRTERDRLGVLLQKLWAAADVTAC